MMRFAAVAAPPTVLLVSPRSFCAGVERAIETVEQALDRFEGPIYVRKRIVHNTHVAADLRKRGVVGVTAGASTPPALADGVITALSGLGPVEVVERETVHESVQFALPAVVRSAMTTAGPTTRRSAD